MWAARWSGFAGCAQVAEWLMAADCKSATLRVTEVRILPCAPFSFELVSCERCGSESCRQRTYGNCAGGTWGVGGFSLADDGAGEVPIADMDTVRIFCLPRHTRAAEFAVGL